MSQISTLQCSAAERAVFLLPRPLYDRANDDQAHSALRCHWRECLTAEPNGDQSLRERTGRLLPTLSGGRGSGLGFVGSLDGLSEDACARSGGLLLLRSQQDLARCLEQSLVVHRTRLRQA